MNIKKIILFIFVFFIVQGLKAQTQKFDTTVKYGDKGYRVTCNNKEPDKNEVDITPINLKSKVSKPSFNVNGIVTKAFTDDFNDDGLPDLAICVYSGEGMSLGNVVAISFTADKTFAAMYFPEIYLDSKIREGYKGHDQFSALTGTILRKFPIYLPTDTDTPTGGIRTVQYKAMEENGHLTFKVLRWFDVKS